MSADGAAIDVSGYRCHCGYYQFSPVIRRHLPEEAPSKRKRAPETSREITLDEAAKLTKPKAPGKAKAGKGKR